MNLSPDFPSSLRVKSLGIKLPFNNSAASSGGSMVLLSLLRASDPLPNCSSREKNFFLKVYPFNFPVAGLTIDLFVVRHFAILIHRSFCFPELS